MRNEESHHGLTDHGPCGSQPNLRLWVLLHCQRPARRIPDSANRLRDAREADHHPQLVWRFPAKPNYVAERKSNGWHPNHQEENA